MNLPGNNSQHQLSIDYKGVQIELLISGTPALALKINGIIRGQKHSTHRSGVFLSLSSSVQTDYEYHEFIEASAFFTVKDVQVKISANKSNLFEATIIL